MPTPAILYGALLAGVDYLLVGAGIPRDFPALLDGLIAHPAPVFKAVRALAKDERRGLSNSLRRLLQQLEGGAAGPREHARLVLEPGGTFAVYTGSSSVGQGLETVMTQSAAEAPGRPWRKASQSSGRLASSAPRYR